MTNVFIDGREGTTGLGIEDRLRARADIHLIAIADDLRKDSAERRRRLNQADVAFLCLPDAAAKEAVAMVENEKTIVIDASTAHRTQPGWAYGFAELSDGHRAAIAQGKRIAVPGCHAGGFLSLVYPMVSSGLLPADYPIVCHSVTGYSGGGKKMIAQYRAEDRPEELSSPRQYALSQNHKHLGEMQAVAGLAQPPIFTPIVADFFRGMAVTVPIYPHLLARRATLLELHALFEAHYRGKPLVKVRPPIGDMAYLGSNNLSGKDFMEIFVCGNDQRVLLIARFDNLGKGASGAAVECMNIALGLDDTMSLSV
jgi:N-acetyl-gamma-glutamyl-phosphate reductase